MKADYFIGENIKKEYFRSELVEQLSLSGRGVDSAGGKLTIYLPSKLGFCHGVVRAIRMAMHTVEKYHDRNIYLLNEIVHNKFVNCELQRVGINYIDGSHKKNNLGLAGVTSSDIVIIPAFGGSASVYNTLTQIGCTTIETTCGEVLSVWKRIQKYNESGFTTLIFGKYFHEETIATSSRSNKYLVAKNLTEMEMIASYIQSSSTSKAWKFREHFYNACSSGFDPENDLQKVGLASQTTMYANEFIQATEIIRQALIYRYGKYNLKDHFSELDTICSATQERQDAIQLLLPRVEHMIVVGGYNSSNTVNLARIASERLPTYHIEGSNKIIHGEITYLPIDSRHEIHQMDWLPKQEHLNIGITSGASTPDSMLEQVIWDILALDGGIK